MSAGAGARARFGGLRRGRLGRRRSPRPCSTPARVSRRSSRDARGPTARLPPRVAPEYGAVRMAFVHHTENPNGYSPARGARDAARDLRLPPLRAGAGTTSATTSWSTSSGASSRPAPAGSTSRSCGAQAGGYNLDRPASRCSATSVRACRISPAARSLRWSGCSRGSSRCTACPSRGRVTVRVNPAGAVYSRFPASAHVPLPRIAGHRDGDSTDCPGDALYGELPAIARAPCSSSRRVLFTPRSRVAAAPVTQSAEACPPAAPKRARPAGGGEPAGRRAGRAHAVGNARAARRHARSPARVLMQARRVSRGGARRSEHDRADALTDAHAARGRCRRASPCPTRARHVRCARCTSGRLPAAPRCPGRTACSCARSSRPLADLPASAHVRAARSARPLPEQLRLARREAVLGLGAHEQRRRRARVGPALAGGR